MSDYFLQESIRDRLLNFSKYRQVQLSYGMYTDGDKKGTPQTTRRFFLTNDNYDEKMGRIHEFYHTYPMGVHYSIQRFQFYPHRAEGIFALDYVIDIDGGSFRENVNIMVQIVKILKEHGFYWAPKKKMWYWRADEFKSYGRKSTSMNDIRNKYGSSKVVDTTNKLK